MCCLLVVVVLVGGGEARSGKRRAKHKPQRDQDQGQEQNQQPVTEYDYATDDFYPDEYDDDDEYRLANTGTLACCNI